MLRIYEVVLDVVRDLNPVVAVLERKDKALADQLNRARTSIPLNLREGSHGRGKARAHRYSLASGSADECIAILDVAVACGYLGPQPALHTKLQHIIGTLMKCQK